ncbi:MAG: hypothetical protein V4558_05630 [Gemmatimonadota bacterium]
MQAIIRRKMSMAGKALAFERAYPATDESHAGVVARLAALVTKFDSIISQERSGAVGEHAAVARRKKLRQDVRERLRHLVRVADFAAKENPDLAGKFVGPQYNGPNRVFLGIARTLLQQATDQQDLLVKAGLGTTFIEDLTKSIAAFLAASLDLDAGRRNHIGARADFGHIADQCIGLVGVLDGLNTARFSDDPDLLAAWKATRNVFGPFTKHDIEDGVVGSIPPAPGADEKVA